MYQTAAVVTESMKPANADEVKQVYFMVKSCTPSRMISSFALVAVGCDDDHLLRASWDVVERTCKEALPQRCS
jgi:hypothetical protein